MEKQKYYTPDLSELHVGFEIETFNISEEWLVIIGNKGSEKHEYEKAQILTEKYYDRIKWYKKTIMPTNISTFMPFKVHVSDEPIFSSKKTKVSVEYFPLNYVRVKYLDKEDIESLGFSHIGSLWFENKEKDFGIRKWKENEIDIYSAFSYRSHDEHIKVFSGNIKNKSELKRLLTQIGVL